jgi:hypothetical protein
MKRTGSIARYAGASAYTYRARTSLPRPVPGTTLIAIPSLDRVDREAHLVQLAGDACSGTPPSWFVTSIAVTALSSPRLGAEERAAAWDHYLLARRRLDGILDGSPALVGVMTVAEAAAAAWAWLDRLLDGSPAPAR